MSLQTSLNASKGLPYWRQAQEEYDPKDEIVSNPFVDDAAEVDEDDEEDDEEEEEDRETGLLSHQTQLMYTSRSAPVERVGQLLEMKASSSDQRLATVVYTTARRRLEELSNLKPGHHKLYALTDTDITNLILDVFIAGQPSMDDTSSNSSNGSNDDDDRQWDLYRDGSRVHDVIENVNATRALRPAMNLQPYNISIAMAAMPESEQLIVDSIMDVMNDLFTYSSGDEDDEDGEDEDEYDDDAGETVVESIVGHRAHKGRQEYLVRWSGFDSSHDEWLSRDQLADAPLVLEEYHKMLKVEEGDEARNNPPDAAKHARLRRRRHIVDTSSEDET